MKMKKPAPPVEGVYTIIFIIRYKYDAYVLHLQYKYTNIMIYYDKT